MKLQEFISDIETQVYEFVEENSVEVKPDVMGLDKRCSYRLAVNEEFIAVRKEDDRNLQYFGGFEYVNSEYRIDLGSHVFYSYEDSRVLEHIEKWRLAE